MFKTRLNFTIFKYIQISVTIYGVGEVGGTQCRNNQLIA